MLDIFEARKLIANAAAAIGDAEALPLKHARNRISAVDCAALVDAPPADNSAMDGYAFAAPDGEPPWQLPLSQTITAGSAPQPLEPGTAARIFTGANIPTGADTVAMQENCEAQDGQVTVQQTAKGANIRARGQDFARGRVLIKRGQVLRAPQLALLAAAGVDHVEVVRAPRIALLNTGNELVEPGAPLREGQIYDSNSTMLRALCQGWGCQIVEHIHVADDLTQTQEALQAAAANADLIITSGGVSVGDEDHVKAAVSALGQLDLWKIRMKPGKPLAFGHIRRAEGKSTAVIGLPGNPVSSFVTAVLFVKAFINGLYGRPDQAPQAYSAAAGFTIDAPRKRPEFLRVQMQDNRLVPFSNQSSGVLSSLAWADALALIEPERLPIKPGDKVGFYPLLQLIEL